jgi:hypothetical protein
MILTVALSARRVAVINLSPTLMLSFMTIPWFRVVGMASAPQADWLSGNAAATATSVTPGTARR